MLKRLRRVLGANFADLVLRHAPIAVMVLRGEELRMAYLNPAAEAMVKPAAEVEGKRFEELFPKAAPDSRKLLLQVIHSGRAARFEERESVAVLTDRNAPSYLTVDCVPLDSSGDGHIDSVILLVQDVTQQVELRRVAEWRAQEAEAAHRALAEREAQLRLSASSAPLVLYARDRELRLTWIYKPRGAKDLSPHLGKSLSEVVHPEDAQALEALYHDVMTSGRPRQELMKFHGSALLEAPWQNVHVQPLRDEQGAVAGVICAAYDVSELMEARAALAEREALLSLALESSDMGVWAYDSGSKSVRHAGGISRLFGLPGADEYPLSAFLDRIAPEHRQLIVDGLENTWTTGRPLNAEFRIQRADQQTRWLSTRARLRRRAGEGEADRIIGVTLDMTEERQLRERLEQSNRSLERFAHTVARGLKSPLQNMVGFARLLQRSTKSRLTPAEQEQLEYILAAGRQMDLLIDGILAQASALHAPLSESVELEAALAQARDRLRLAIEQAGAEVAHQPLPRVSGHPVLLTQILQNLIGNAIKYRERTRPLRIDIAAERRENEWVISVADNGIGIPVEYRDRLFEAFQRGHTDADYGGVGLGLSLVREAVDRHGGRVWLDSAPGQGTTFYFSLPDLNAASTGVKISRARAS